MKTTTVKLNYDEVLGLLDSIESVAPELREPEEVEILDRLYKRLTRALDRVA